ncbi:hypothetical protein SAMN05519104_5942 [Rhizobiales bacterium GAS188]|nr:hypothetical protein SAMN05519104_5942 [Rhizobiales bacterium GAS188]
MKYARISCFAGTVALTLAVPVGHALAHSKPASMSAAEITQVVKGKICSTKGGAEFSFGSDGRYGYDGLWKDEGSYAVNRGTITVTSESGLERSFAISKKGGAFYMEQTALTCETAGAK